MTNNVKAILMGLTIVCVFALGGVGIYRGDVSVTAAIATALAALSSAGVMTRLGAVGSEEN